MKMDFSGGQLSALGSSSEVILKDNVEYMNLASLAPQMRGKRWVKIDLNAISKTPGAAGSLGSLSKLNENVDPAQQVKLLLTSGDLKKIGTETVDGVRSTHFGGTVDPAKMVDKVAAGKLTPDEVAQLKNTMQQAGVTSEHIDLWVDKGGLPVESKAVVTSTSAGQIEADQHFSNWGTPVTITPPPADQVTDLSQLRPGSA
jgi:hypothetical protein